MKKVLITGGNGFIAKNLTEKFKEQYDLVSLGRKELDLLDTELVYKYLSKNEFDIILHTATYDAYTQYSNNDPNKVIENNLKMFFNLVRCERYFGRMFYFGSGAEFGRENWKENLKESDFDNYVPTDPYGFSKYVMAKHAISSNKIINLRIFSIFGKYEDWRIRFISNACCRVINDMPIKINQNTIFNFTDVNDLCNIINVFFYTRPMYKDYNICNTNTYSLVDIANRIFEISKKNTGILIKKTGMGNTYDGNNDRLLSEIGNYKFTPINVSIERLYNWYITNKVDINLL